MKTRTVQLSEVCDMKDGTHFTPPNTGGPFPFLTVKDMTDEGLSFRTCSYISAKEFDRTRKARACPEKGAVLFSKDGTVGKVHVVGDERPFAVLSSIAILRPRQTEVDSRYLGFALQDLSILGDAENRKTGSALRRIIVKDLKDVSIPLPSIPEQRRIAALLELADRLRRTRRFALELSANFLSAAFLEIFGDTSLPQTQWPRTSISELCESVIDCVNKTAPTVDYPTAYFMIRTSNVRGGEILLHSLKCVAKETFDKWTRRSMPKVGDVILTREAPLGEAGILRADVHIFLGQRLVQYRANPQRTVPEYLLFALRSRDLQHQMRRLGAGSTVEHISVPECEALAVAVPPLPLQQRFADLVRGHERLRAAQRESLRQAEHLFQSLLHQAFSEVI